MSDMSPQQASRSLKRLSVALVAVGSLAVLGVVFWGLKGADATVGEAPPARPPEKMRSSSGRASVEPGPVHEVKPALEWVAGAVDAQDMRKRVERAPKLSLAIRKNYDLYSALDDWAWSYVTDDEFGAKVLECRVTYESRVEAEACHWGQGIVLRQIGGGRGEVIYVETRPGAAMDDPSCVAWADCIRGAWEGRKGPFPVGAPETDDGYFAFKAGVWHPGGHAMDAREYLAFYEGLLSERERDSAELGTVHPETRGQARYRHLVTKANSEIRDLELVIAHLRRVP